MQFTHGVGMHSPGPHFCGATPHPKALAAQHAPGESPGGGVGGAGGKGVGPRPRVQLPTMAAVGGQVMLLPSGAMVPLLRAQRWLLFGSGQTTVQSCQSQKNMVGVRPEITPGAGETQSKRQAGNGGAPHSKGAAPSTDSVQSLFCVTFSR